MSTGDRDFDIVVPIFYAETRLRRLRGMSPEDVFGALEQDLSLIGLMRPKRDNTELVDDGLRLTWTVLARNLNKVRAKLSRWLVGSFSDRASDQLPAC
jgi:hypothetical protein